MPPLPLLLNESLAPSAEPQRIMLPNEAIMRLSPTAGQSACDGIRTPQRLIGPRSPPPMMPPKLPIHLAYRGADDCSPPPGSTAPASTAFPSPPPAPPSPPMLPPTLAQLQEALPPPPAVPPSSVTKALSLPCKILRWDKADEVAECANVECDSEGEQEDSQDGPRETFAQSRTGSVVKFPPGLQPPPNTPSHGSVLHTEGSCRPCAWFWKPSGCKNGQNCGHCHLCPSSEIKARKRAKQTILRLGLSTPKDVTGECYDPRVAMVLAEQEHREAEEARSRQPGSDQESTTYTTSDTEIAGGSDRSSDSPKWSSRIIFPPGLETAADPKACSHLSSDCKPCAWFWKPVGCKSGAGCKYCHVCPQEELKLRKKSKLEAIRLGLVTPKATVEDPRFSLSLSSLL